MSNPTGQREEGKVTEPTPSEASMTPPKEETAPPESFSRRMERAVLSSRVRSMHHEIEAGNTVMAKEHAIHAAHLGMAVLGMDAGLVGWGIYDEVVKWWNGGN